VIFLLYLRALNDFPPIGHACWRPAVFGRSQASAAIVNFTYTGTILSGSDQYNTWGTGNSDLKGDSFRLVFTVNTDGPFHGFDNAPTMRFTAAPITVWGPPP
jgi:hypothetical protein